jgi:hypothetical protein
VLDPNPNMMAVNKTLGAPEDARSSEEEEEEVEKLEADVKEMAHKILEYRATLPDQLRTTLASALAAQRPVSPDGLGLAPSGAPNTGHVSRFSSFFIFGLDYGWLYARLCLRKHRRYIFFFQVFQFLRFPRKGEKERKLFNEMVYYGLPSGEFLLSGVG